MSQIETLYATAAQALQDSGLPEYVDIVPYGQSITSTMHAIQVPCSASEFVRGKWLNEALDEAKALDGANPGLAPVERLPGSIYPAWDFCAGDQQADYFLLAFCVKYTPDLYAVQVERLQAEMPADIEILPFGAPAGPETREWYLDPLYPPAWDAVVGTGRGGWRCGPRFWESDPESKARAGDPDPGAHNRVLFYFRQRRQAVEGSETQSEVREAEPEPRPEAQLASAPEPVVTYPIDLDALVQDTQEEVLTRVETNTAAFIMALLVGEPGVSWGAIQWALQTLEQHKPAGELAAAFRDVAGSRTAAVGLWGAAEEAAHWLINELEDPLPIRLYGPEDDEGEDDEREDGAKNEEDDAGADPHPDDADGALAALNQAFGRLFPDGQSPREFDSVWPKDPEKGYAKIEHALAKPLHDLGLELLPYGSEVRSAPDVIAVQLRDDPEGWAEQLECWRQGRWHSEENPNLLSPGLHWKAGEHYQEFRGARGTEGVVLLLRILA